MANLKLTNEQRRFVSKNHNLIYDYAYTYNLDIDEWYGVLAIGLCKATMGKFDNTKSKFSTFAYKCMRNAVKQEYLKRSQDKEEANNHTVSIFTPTINNQQSEGECNYADIIPNLHIRVDTEAMLKVALKEAISNLKTDNQRKIISLITYGYTQSEVAQITNKQRSYVHDLLVKFRELFIEQWSVNYK